MEEIRTYGRNEEDNRHMDEDRIEMSAAGADDEVPFHIPRD